MVSIYYGWCHLMPVRMRFGESQHRFVWKSELSSDGPSFFRMLREFPDSGYVKIGEVSAEMPLTFRETNETFEAKLKAEAARIGADALVVREDEPFKLTQTQTSWNAQTYRDKKGRVHTTGTAQNREDEFGRKVYGIAIKFTGGTSSGNAP